MGGPAARLCVRPAGRDAEGGADAAWKTVTLRLDPRSLDLGDEGARGQDREMPAQLSQEGEGGWAPVTLKAKPEAVAVIDGPAREADAQATGSDGDWKPVTLRVVPSDVALTAWKTISAYSASTPGKSR